jgi:hypothetical protein
MTKSDGVEWRRRQQASHLIVYDVTAGDPAHEIAAALRLGTTVKGRLVEPNGQQFADAMIIGTLYLLGSIPAQIVRILYASWNKSQIANGPTSS